MNELLERCAGMDVHKESITVCKMIGFGKSIKKEIETFGTTTAELYKLADWLRSNDIKEVAIESTGVYWKCVHNIMEFDFHVTLTNPRHMKNIPGKKTDVKDAEWICRLLKHGLLQKSFIPPKSIRNMREFTRLRKKYVQLKTSAKNRIIKFLESANIKLKSIVSNIEGKSSWNIITAIAQGITDPEALAQLVTTKLRANNQKIKDALTGVLDEHACMMVKLAVQEVEFYEQKINDIDVEIKKAEQEFEEELGIVRTFPGIGEITGSSIVAEIGVDMKQFPTENHLTSWAGLAPGNNESAGKTKNTRINKGNNYLKVVLLQSAWSAVAERNGYWTSIYHRLKSRLGVKKAIIAIARRMLKTIHYALSVKKSYQNLNLKRDPEQTERAIAYYTKKLAQLKQQVTPA